MTDLPPLTMLEEFLILALDNKTGQLCPIDPHILNSATAGAMLMDLALRNRIDNDQNDMFTVDPTPTGDALLDPILHTMSLAPVLAPHPIAYWLRHISVDAEGLREKAMQRLEKRGIIHAPLINLFWMFGPQETRHLDEEKMRDVKARLSACVLDSDLPSPRNVMLIGLVDACDLLRFILKDSDLAAITPRVEQMTRLDLISQAVVKGIALDNSSPATEQKQTS